MNSDLWLTNRRYVPRWYERWAVMGPAAVVVGGLIAALWIGVVR